MSDHGHGWMVQSLHDDQQTDKDGMATWIYPGMLPGRTRFGFSTPTRRRARKLMSRGKRHRAQRRGQVGYHRAKYAIARMQRDNFMREVEEALEQLVRDGEIVKNPNGTYQSKPPTLADRMHDRRDRMRGES